MTSASPWVVMAEAVAPFRVAAEVGIAGVDMANPNFKDQCWSVSQMLTHHASHGCLLRSGDLISSGTVSGPERNDSGRLLERIRDGRETITLPKCEVRSAKCERISKTETQSPLSGRCGRAGFRAIGFGECVAEQTGDL
jgi:fumarylacetoacetase